MDLEVEPFEQLILAEPSYPIHWSSATVSGRFKSLANDGFDAESKHLRNTPRIEGPPSL